MVQTREGKTVTETEATCTSASEHVSNGEQSKFLFVTLYCAFSCLKDRVFLFVFGGRDSTYEDDELAYKNAGLPC